MSAWMRNTVMARRAARTRFISVRSPLHMDISFSTTTVRILQKKNYVQAIYIVHDPTIPVHITRIARI